MDPREFHLVAERLATGKSPAELRTAAFNVLADELRVMGIRMGKGIRALDAAFTGPQRAAIQAAVARWRRENGYP